MNSRKTILIMTAAVLLSAALSGCGDNIVEVNTLDPNALVTTAALADATTAVTEATTAAKTEAASKTTAASTTTSTAAVTTAAATSATAAATETATEAPAANNEQQQNDTPSAANHDLVAQTQAPQTPAATQAPATQAPATQAPATQAPPPAAETYLFDALHVDTECSAYIASHPGYRYEEALSCIGSGQDRTYTYSNYKLITYFENGTETLKEIDITGAGIATRKDISVGSTAAAVEQAYGAPSAPGEYIYSTSDGTVDIIVTNGAVTMICIYT